MKQTGTFPSPYGVTVPVFENPDDPETVLFAADGCAICAGIHDPKQRQRFAEDMKSAGRCDLERLSEYGGGKLLRIDLPRPSSPAYPQIPNSGETAMPIEAWITMILDRHRWCDRSDELLHIIEDNFENAGGWEPILVLGMQIMLTGTLEHLPDREIDCLEAAAFYALSVHDEWSRAAVKWLQPMSGTWFRDWVAARPSYARFAALCQINSALPAWISGSFDDCCGTPLKNGENT